MIPGFKEWALVCDALGSGAQSLILRKGGIAEGRAGFRFAHGEFLLFPTLFHEQLQKLRLPDTTPVPGPRADGQLEIRYLARAEWTREIDALATAARLAPFHCWREEVIEERFRYSEKAGLSLAWVRVFRLPAPFVFPDAPAYGGCRSWVSLPEPPPGEPIPVLEEAAHRARERALLSILGPVSAPVAAARR